MTERLRHGDPGSGTSRGRPPGVGRGNARGASAIPVPPPRPVCVEGEATILGFPAEPPTTEDTSDVSVAAAGLPASPSLVHVRRADSLGAAPLVLAGVAANVSLSLSWSPGRGPSGLALVEEGVRGLGSGAAWGAHWEPFAVVLCGGLLVAFGFLLMVPARSHRLVGVLALVVALAAAAAVVLLVAGTDAADERLGPGLWCAAAVPVLGLLGALKAMLTAPLVALAPSGRRRSVRDPV